MVADDLQLQIQLVHLLERKNELQKASQWSLRYNIPRDRLPRGVWEMQQSLPPHLQWVTNYAWTDPVMQLVVCSSWGAKQCAALWDFKTCSLKLTPRSPHPFLTQRDSVLSFTLLIHISVATGALYLLERWWVESAIWILSHTEIEKTTSKLVFFLMVISMNALISLSYSER